jgi:peptidoglycan-N-acetylglucosamine deacetylase
MFLSRPWETRHYPRSMTSLVWPEGMTSAAALTFDVDAESVWLAMDPGNAERPGVLSQGRYGPRVGLPLILALLADKRLRATFFIPGVNVSLYPGAIDAIIRGGHEVALHGYTHTRPSLLKPDEERNELERSFEVLTAAGGVVAGYRAPGWDVSAQTLDLLEEKGLLYASQFMDDITPYRHPGRRLIELPVQWILDDWPHFGWHAGDSGRTIKGTHEVEAIWSEEFEGIHRHGGSTILTMHPQVTGRPSRVALLGRMIDRMQRMGDVWIATCAEIAAVADAQL